MIVHNLVNKAFRFADRAVGKLFGSYVSERQKLQDGTVKEHYGPRAHLHWQNLNDNERGKPKGVPYEGRCWLWFRGFGERDRNIGFSWNFWHPHWLFNFHVAFKDESDVQFGLGLWPVSFHLSFENFFPRRFKDWWHAKYEYSGREVWIYATRDESITGGVNFCWNFWRDPDGGSMKKTWREKIVTFPDVILSPLFGRIKHSEETLEDKDITIPMPEGMYEGKAKLSRSTWKRPRLPFTSHVRHGAWVDIPIGIPYEGKGENSWDCGEDGIFGIGTDKPSYPALIARVVEHVLSQRKKRDGNMYAKYPDPALRKTEFEKRRAEAEVKRARGEDQPMSAS